MKPLITLTVLKRSIHPLTKSLIPAVVLVGMLQTAQAAVHSPKGAEMYTPEGVVVPPAPAFKTITVNWSYPAAYETPDLVFKLYHSTNLSVPVTQWELLTNIPGNVRSAIIPADQPQDFFVLTASNYLGESGPGTPAN